MSRIAWTEETWNPVVGCTRVSPGCRNCYAIGVAHRALQPAHKGLTVRTENGPDWSGTIRCLPDRLGTPMRWKKPRLVFVGSMTDLFHPDVPTEFLGSIWNTMAVTPRHTYQVLTKRPQWMAEQMLQWNYSAGFRDHRMRWVQTPMPLPNVWMGTSIETNRFCFRADHLRHAPAALRFLSLEPLLGPLTDLDLGGIDWVIVGAESLGSRPGRECRLEWVREIAEKCDQAGVPLFVKQLHVDGGLVKDVDGFPEDLQRQEMPEVRNG